MSRRLHLSFLTLLCVTTFWLAGTHSAQAQNDVTKWLQPPDLVNGVDVNITIPSIVADDFKCYSTGPITDMTFWGSWLNDVVSPVALQIGFWSDVPATPNTPSHPGDELASFVSGYITGSLYYTYPTGTTEPWWNPNYPNSGPMSGTDTQVWQYDLVFNNPFIQTAGNIYWVSIEALPQNPDAYLGWKTSYTQNLDNAAWNMTDANGDLTGDWNEVIPPYYPYNTSRDMAFELSTTPEPSTGLIFLIGIGGIRFLKSRIRTFH